MAPSLHSSNSVTFPFGDRGMGFPFASSVGTFSLPWNSVCLKRLMLRQLPKLFGLQSLDRPCRTDIRPRERRAPAIPLYFPSTPSIYISAGTIERSLLQNSSLGEETKKMHSLSNRRKRRFFGCQLFKFKPSPSQASGELYLSVRTSPFHDSRARTALAARAELDRGSLAVVQRLWIVVHRRDTIESIPKRDGENKETQQKSQSLLMPFS